MPVEGLIAGIGAGPGWTRAGLARQQIPVSGPGSGLRFRKFRAPGRAPGWGAGLRDPGQPVFFSRINLTKILAKF